MKMHVDYFLLLVVLICQLGCRQSVAKDQSDWGPVTNNIQLSIGLSSNIVTAGSTAVLHTRIRNRGTNDISLVVIRQFPYTLTNDSGGVYKVTSPMFENDLKNTTTLEDFIVHSGGTNEWPTRLKFEKEIVPGDYVITPITRDVTTADGKVYTLMSNSLKVKVISPSPP